MLTCRGKSRHYSLVSILFVSYPLLFVKGSHYYSQGNSI